MGEGDSEGWPWFVAGCALAAAGALVWSLFATRRLRFLADTPTSKAKGVFVGHVELAGEAVREPPLRSYLANFECVWWRHTVEEEWERWETKTVTDKDGRKRTERVRRSGWKTVVDYRSPARFFVQDETGVVRIDPAGAKVVAIETLDRVASRTEGIYYEKGPRPAIGDSTHRRRFREEAIPLGRHVFVAGRARERTDAVALEIAAAKGQDLFVIRCDGERGARTAATGAAWAGALLGAGLVALAAWLPARAPWAAVAGGAGAAVLWALGWLWVSYNGMVQLRHRVAQAASLIDVQLKRRADLIPRLVEVVRGLQTHEKEVQFLTATLRTDGAVREWQTGGGLHSVRRELVALAEAYPALRANFAFLKLQHELTDAEERIALARDYYNEIATHANIRAEIVPDRWIADAARLRPFKRLVAEEFERSPVALSAHDVLPADAPRPETATAPA